MKKTIITILCLFLMSCGGVSPWPSISSNPDDFVNVDTATFVVDGCGSGGCDYSIDGSDYISFTSPLELTDLAEGEHTLQISSGGEVITSHVWTVDTTAPTAAFDSIPDANSNSTSATFTFVSNEAGVTFEYSLDDIITYAACTSPLTLTDFSEGEHTVRIRARDVAGNLSLVANTSFTIDITAPTATIDSDPGAFVNCAIMDATFTFSSNEEGSTFECRPNNDSFAACTSPVTYDIGDLACPGSHTFEVRAVDAVGNTGTADSHSWNFWSPFD